MGEPRRASCAHLRSMAYGAVFSCLYPKLTGHRHRARPRRGSSYVIVLGTTLIVATLSLGGLLAVRAQTRNVDSYHRSAAARQYALAAIELGLQAIASDANWRANNNDVPGGFWYQNRPIGDGNYTLQVTNPNGELNNSPDDAVVLRGIGTVHNGAERQMLEVTLLAQSVPLTCLQVAEVAGSTIGFGTTTINAINQIIASNATGIATSTGGSGANVYAQVEAVGTVGGNTFYQTVTSDATPRTLPDPATVFDYYLAHGTYIDFNSLPASGTGRTITQRLISPASNPFGPTNAQGIYIINCGGQSITFAQNRIVGTIVLLEPMGGTSSYYQNQNLHVPAVENYPALLVRGDFSCRMNTSLLTEGSGLNFNPPGTPYPWPSGSTDSDTTDSYPNEIRGLIYVSGNFQTQTAATLGQVVVGGVITHMNGSYTLNYNPLYYSNPPPGFSLIRMLPAPGSWRQVTD